MKPQLVLLRILRRPSTPSNRTPSPSPRDSVHHTGTAQWDVNHPFHLAALESQGILQTYMLETADGGAEAHLYPCVAFQLHLSFGVSAHEESGNKCGDTSRKDWNEFYNGLKPIKQPWGSFEFIPKRRGEIIFFQAESSRILFAKLPGGSPRTLISYDEDNAATQIEQDRSKVYCVGRHSSTILSIAVRPDGLVLASAGRDGCLRIWRLSDGTMIAQTMFARWRQPRNPGIGRVSPLRRQNDEIDCAYPAVRVVSFFGKAWDVAMGCPSGEARTWTHEVGEGSPLTIKRIAESATLFSGKSPVSALALHVPDTNFPLQREGDNAEDEESYSARLAVSFQERVAVGTTNGKLQVWTRHRNLGDWSPTWSTTPSAERASIVCLSFRADGGLLAAAASFLAKRLTDEQTEALLLTFPPRKIKRVCERLYLYETLSWGCVGSLNFGSQIGTCLFYRPPFRTEDKKDPSSCVSREKVSSCRVLLVATANGPQALILPEHGLFGYRDRRHRQQPVGCFRKEAKTVRWADLKRERGAAQQSFSSSPCPSDRRLRSAPAVPTSTYCRQSARRSDREHPRPVMEEDLVWAPNSPVVRSQRMLNASPAARPRYRSPPCRSRSPAGCVHSVGRPPFRDPYQDPSLLSLPAECVGLPMDVVMKYRAGSRQCPPQVKTSQCVCCSKQARSKELLIPYPMGQVVIQQLKNVAAKPNPSAAARPPPRRKARKPTGSCVGLADFSPTPSRLETPQFKRKPRTILSMKFDVDDENDNDQAPAHEHDESVSECESQFHDEDCPSLLQQQQQQFESQTGPNEPTLDPECIAAGDISGGEGKVESEEEQGDAEAEENVREETPPASGAASHEQAPGQRQQKHPHQPVIGGNRLYTVSVKQHFKGGKENIHDPDERCSDSPRHHPLGGIPQYSSSGKDSPVQSQQQLFASRSSPHFVGGDNLPDKHIVGGNELEDLLVKERCPLKSVGPAVREIAKERKLVQPEPFSTAQLLARLREIEQETFNVEAALRVAKQRGIQLDDEDEKELRKALDEESKQTTVTKRKGPETERGKPTVRYTRLKEDEKELRKALGEESKPTTVTKTIRHEMESGKPCVRYTKLKKVTDPRVSHPGPVLAARKVRKQVDPKWEDMRTLKPALTDLWELKERYAQVCSPAPADIDHNVMYVGVERDTEESELTAQSEATCRHAWSSQAVYDGCLYKPDQRAPNCGCNIRVHVRR